jgi:EAL domain-containing protein (putative c-di-GMP-specific phosphodiesterase class I)
MTVSRKLLVIDDDIDICDLIDSTASGLGLRCTTTTDSGAFFQALKPDIDLIVLDLIMPNTDGIEILRRLGDCKCQAGIIVISGVGTRVLQTAETLASALGLSIVGQLTKPFSIAQLEEMLTRTPKSSSAQESGRASPSAIRAAEILRGIEQQEFILYYQPQIEIATRKCLGVEALARWQHPTRGLIQPNDFIQFAEQFNLIDKLTCTLIERGLTEIGEVKERLGETLTISFNLSVFSLRDLSFPDKLLSIANERGISPERIILEITESGLIRELTRTLDVMTRLRMKGVRLSIDDFGTGYSMMQQLQLIPANELKIDKSLLQNLQIDDNKAMIEKIIELTAELDMVSVAEGVETSQQLDFLREKNCDIAQGYLFSKPVPRLELLAWLDEYQRRA